MSAFASRVEGSEHLITTNGEVDRSNVVPIDAVATACRMYETLISNWASDYLRLQIRGLDQPCWLGREPDRFFDIKDDMGLVGDFGIGTISEFGTNDSDWQSHKAA